MCLNLKFHALTNSLKAPGTRLAEHDTPAGDNTIIPKRHEKELSFEGQWRYPVSFPEHRSFWSASGIDPRR